ncbi:SCO family protein [Aromatoleum petrolei]|uniref:Redoxin domain-containing protein n=1 Tax=Aromatoleum petrolei TaxID=76116 RepID=A0ABX1MMX4_9RHOO|nr:SCO family protein [Aromatoleum petrolei]NMF87399.1 redoxin domain-containing protein [Aromatoleum petrolei]QTQ35766.1 SCO1/SenC family protein [Aromatoleum petrolei]
MLRTLIVAATLAVATLAACSNPSATIAFRATDITGADYGKGLALSDHTGAPRTLADFRGKVVTLFFGYTQCPDVCPTNLSTMAEVMRQLGPDAERVQVLFVTVDPERDTQQLLAQYIPVFDPRFIALRGDPAQTAAVAKEFKVFYQKSGDTSGANYTVDHSTGTYVFDPTGRVRLYVKHGETADNIAADVRTLLAGK